MEKHHIYQKLLTQLEGEVKALTDAARHTMETATHEEFQAKSKYDTFSLEQSYLARGQAQRVEEIAETLSRLRAFQPPLASGPSGVEPGSLVEVANPGGDQDWYFLLPAGGGEEVAHEDVIVTVLSASSPLGRALQGKRIHDVLTLPARPETTLRILRVL